MSYGNKAENQHKHYVHYLHDRSNEGTNQTGFIQEEAGVVSSVRHTYLQVLNFQVQSFKV